MVAHRASRRLRNALGMNRSSDGRYSHHGAGLNRGGNVVTR